LRHGSHESSRSQPQGPGTEPLKPTNRFGSPQASLKHFTDARAQTRVFLKTHDDLRDHAIDSPMERSSMAMSGCCLSPGTANAIPKQDYTSKGDPNFPKA